jgi:hypothetical protein
MLGIESRMCPQAGARLIAEIHDLFGTGAHRVRLDGSVRVVRSIVTRHLMTATSRWSWTVPFSHFRLRHRVGHVRHDGSSLIAAGRQLLTNHQPVPARCGQECRAGFKNGYFTKSRSHHPSHGRYKSAARCAHALDIPARRRRRMHRPRRRGRDSPCSRRTPRQ